MNQRLQLRRSVCLTALLTSLTLGVGYAGMTAAHKHVISIQITGAELIEADVSELQPGEAMSFTTENGRLIDILQGINGVEIYLDGELIGSPDHQELQAVNNAISIERLLACEDADAGGCTGAHTQSLHREVEIHCISDAGDDCDTFTFLEADEDIMLEERAGADVEKVIVIHKEQSQIQSD